MLIGKKQLVKLRALVSERHASASLSMTFFNLRQTIPYPTYMAVPRLPPAGGHRDPCRPGRYPGHPECGHAQKLPCRRGAPSFLCQEIRRFIIPCSTCCTGPEPFSNWLNKTPDKQLLLRLADKYNLIIVNPEGETFSFYPNSPISPDS